MDPADPLDVLRRYHEETTHSPRPRRRDHVVSEFQPMAPGNRPAAFKRYRDLERQPLPTDIRPGAAAPGALDVLAGRVAGEGGGAETGGAVGDGAVDLDLLARLLYLSAGVTRFAGVGADRTWFRASASAGNLHPLELYVACGADAGVAPGLHHFDPESYTLGRLRSIDVRPHLARAAADEALATAGAVVVVTGIPWRTCWKYAERGWRHIWWDAGSLLANLLAVAAAHGVPARVVLGFVDHEVSHVLGIDGTTEVPVAAVAVGHTAGRAASTSGGDDLRLDPLEALDPLEPAVDPLSPAPVEFPLVVAAHRATELADREAVTRWRDACRAGEGGHAAVATPDPVDVPADVLADLPVPGVGDVAEPIESVILRRGSTRVMTPTTVPGAAVDLALRVATRAVPMDAVPPSRTLLRHQIAVHGVDGSPPGLYRWADATLEQRAGGDEQTTRALSSFLCLGQPLGGDSAYTVFEATDLEAVLGALGPRGYRAAHVEAGIVNGRLLLAAHALGHGATGLTFFDDEVARVFDIPVGCLLVTAVGVPAYRPTPGGWPGEPTRLDHFDTLMTRLELRLRRRA